MRTIALVTQKGGAGKSTLGVFARRRGDGGGERVCLIDMDPQATLSAWGKTRGETDIPVIAASPAKLTAVLSALAAKGVTLALIDTPGAEGPAASAAMAAAQLCVIPVAPDRLRPLGQRQHAQGAEGRARATTCSCSTSARRRSRAPASTRASRRWRRWAACCRRWCWRASTTRKRRGAAGASPSSTPTAPRPARCARCGHR